MCATSPKMCWNMLLMIHAGQNNMKNSLSFKSILKLWANPSQQSSKNWIRKTDATVILIRVIIFHGDLSSIHAAKKISENLLDL